MEEKGPQLTSHGQEAAFDSRYSPHSLNDATSEGGLAKESLSISDIEQHCLLFPTYATRHSRSGSKDPLDWNIRVRGWAFSKQSNRRKRLVMSMARKLAGVTKENKVYETLESRFGMFLASNTQGARFSIQCVGAVNTTHMELAGDPSSHDPAVDILRHEFKSSDAAVAASDAAEDKAKVPKSLEETGSGVYAGLYNIQPRDSSNLIFRKSEPVVGRDTTPAKISLDDQNIGFSSNRWSKGAALVAGTYRKYKPMVVAQVNSGGSSSPTFHRYDQYRPDNKINTADTGTAEASDIPAETYRTDSSDGVFTQSETCYEDLGGGLFPTVHISSRPGGHFDGTIRFSHEDVKAHRKQVDTGVDEEKGPHLRFLSLVAYHAEMTEPCHGIVNLIDPIGISVISDIDDTIKETNIAAGARTILQNTFLRDMQDVPGMSQVYKRWWKQGAAIHYVSNSPWQLIPSLLEFFHLYKFPPGSAHLRLYDSVLKTYFMTPGESKRKSIHGILTDFPDRRFILVGDSGEIDMEIYADVALEFPRQIFKIFIRDITPGQKSKTLTSLIPTPINAVATGLNYLTKQGCPSSSSVNVSNHKDFDKNYHRADGTDETSSVSSLEERTSSGYSSDRTGGSEEESNVYSSTKLCSFEPFRLRSKSFSSDSPTTLRTPLYSTKTTTLHHRNTDSTSETAHGESTLPPSTELPLKAKSPLEIWKDRVEQCQKRLPEGLLTFFTEADTLGKCSVVNDMLQLYKSGTR